MSDKPKTPSRPKRTKTPASVPNPVPTLTPLTAADCPDLIVGLRTGAVDPLWVHQRIIVTVRGGRLYGTPEWRNLRERLIKLYCEQCSSDVGPMTLQHLWHPTTLTDIAKQLHHADRQEAWERYRVEHELTDGLQDILEPVGPERPGCPICGGYNVRTRSKLTPRWKCLTARNKQICGAEFDKPITTRETKLITADVLRRQAFATQYAPRYRAREWEVLTQAAIVALEEHVAYLSGEGTHTFCKKCAYLWDERGVRLCQGCRDAFHPHHEPHCRACATGGRWVVCSACSKTRHLDRYPTCWSCIGERPDIDVVYPQDDPHTPP